LDMESRRRVGGILSDAHDMAGSARCSNSRAAVVNGLATKQHPPTARARVIADRHSRKAASTEDLPQANVHYRALFEDLLEAREPERRRA
jgi:hypothetical protein